MTLSSLHDPPRALGASAMAMGMPPEASTVFSFPWAKNPSERLSGDQKGNMASSLLSISRGSAESSERTHKVRFPSGETATKATRRPSFESTGEPA